MKLCQRLRFPGMALVNILALWLATSAAAQAPQPAPNDANVAASLTELQSQVRELKDMVLQLKQETTASHAEITRLRQELELERAAAPPQRVRVRSTSASANWKKTSSCSPGRSTISTRPRLRAHRSIACVCRASFCSTSSAIRATSTTLTCRRSPIKAVVFRPLARLAVPSGQLIFGFEELG